MRVVVAIIMAVGCAHERGSVVTQQQRCVVRISERGTFVDGEQISRSDAVAYCRHARGGAVVVTDIKITDPEVRETTSALEREGIRVYVRGRLCDRVDGRDCAPAPVPSWPVRPRREIAP